MKSINYPDTKSGTILIVDDDSTILVLISTVLEADGCRVLLARGDYEAVRLARQKYLHMDVALLDVRMAGMRPTALAKRIQDLRSNVPILFISGFVEDEIIRIRLLDEYTQFLPRPLKRDCLFGAVRLALKIPESTVRGPAGCVAFAAALPGAAGA